MEFPQYRKLKNNKHFYKIISETEFEEIIIIGKKRLSFFKKAEIFPDMVLVRDMLRLSSVDYQASTKEEYDHVRKGNPVD